MTKLFSRLRKAVSRREGSERPSKSTALNQPDAEPQPYTSHKEGAAQQTHLEKAAPESAFQQQARQIAQIQVGGMRRTTAGGGQGTGFITSYAPAQSRGPAALSQRQAGASAGLALPPDGATCSTDGTLVVTDHVDGEKQGDLGSRGVDSMWKGKPNGTAYDSRQELTEEDEDTWARLAM